MMFPEYGRDELKDDILLVSIDNRPKSKIEEIVSLAGDWHHCAATFHIL